MLTGDWPGLVLLLLALPALAVVHEAGHVIAGRLAGFYVTSAGLGAGPWFLRIPVGPAFNLFIGVNLLGGGATVAFPARTDLGPAAQALFHYGGVLAQGTLHAALYGLLAGRPDLAPWLRPVLALNGLTAAANLLPLRLSLGGAVLETDGALAAAALGGRGRGVAPPAHRIATRAAFARPRVGNPVGRFVLDLCVAASGHPPPPGFHWGADPPPGTPAVFVDWLREEAQRHSPLGTGQGLHENA
ncbi:hypothetical protein L6R50_04000 [Myxococcota bacterium]|nr:hypothetical protein [Myxococcota bacterium]